MAKVKSKCSSSHKKISRPWLWDETEADSLSRMEVQEEKEGLSRSWSRSNDEGSASSNYRTRSRTPRECTRSRTRRECTRSRTPRECARSRTRRECTRSRTRRECTRSRTPRERTRHSYQRCDSKPRSRSYSRSMYRVRNRRSYSRSPMSNRRRHYGSRDNPPPNTCIGVFGLSLRTTEQKIESIFKRFGEIEDVRVVYDSTTRKSRGFCFVQFRKIEDAKLAKRQCAGMDIDGRRIRVDYSITLRAHTPTPGVYMGRFRRESSDGDYSGGHRGRYRSPSPHTSRRRRYNRSRSRSYSRRRY